MTCKEKSIFNELKVTLDNKKKQKQENLGNTEKRGIC